MKSKSYAVLLLTSTFLVGCGSGGGAGASSNANPNNQNTGGNANPINQNTGGGNTQNSGSNSGSGSSQAGVVQSKLKANTVAEGLALPEIKSKLEALKPAWNAIKDKQHEDRDSMNPSERDAYIKQFQTFFGGVFSVVFDLQDIAFAKFPDVLNTPNLSLSWEEMAKYSRDREAVSQELKQILTGINEKFGFNIINLNWMPLGWNGLNLRSFYNVPGMKPSIDQWEKQYTQGLEKYSRFEKPIAMNSDDVELVNKFVYSKLELIPRNMLSGIAKELNTNGYTLKKDSEYDVAKNIATTALNLRNFLENYSFKDDGTLEYISSLKGAVPLYIEQARFDLLTTDPQKYIQKLNLSSVDALIDWMNKAEKIIISAMIKSGQFKGLFDYLKDRKIKLGNKEYTPFPAAEYDALVAQAPQQRLAAGISPSTLPRGARDGDARVNATHLQINGIAGGKVAMGLPLSIHLKGNIDGTKSTAGTSGSVAYKMGNTVVGVVHAYGNTGEGFEVGSHQTETSVAVSQSFGDMFVEAQLGVVDTHHVHSADMSGSRYQMSLGYDTQYVSPFVQIAYRDFGKLTDTVGYVGAELNIDSLRADTYSVDVTMTAKAGYSTQSAWQGSLDWAAALNLDNGISCRSDLTLGTHEGAKFGVNLSLSR